RSERRAFARSAIVTDSSNGSVFLCPAAAPPEFYTLALHDALPIWLSLPMLSVVACVASRPCVHGLGREVGIWVPTTRGRNRRQSDRKSTRLNSSHVKISYAVFCLKKKRQTPCHQTRVVTVETAARM